MKAAYRKACVRDAALLVHIYDLSFYADYLKYGECPGYGRSKAEMEDSILRYPKHIILCGGEPVGCVSCKETEPNVYEIGCLCVIPEFQGSSLGTQAIEFVKTLCGDWKKLTLVTPADKTENIKFYTEKCGFRVMSTERDGNVELARLILER